MLRLSRVCRYFSSNGGNSLCLKERINTEYDGSLNGLIMDLVQQNIDTSEFDELLFDTKFKSAWNAEVGGAWDERFHSFQGDQRKFFVCEILSDREYEKLNSFESEQENLYSFSELLSRTIEEEIDEPHGLVFTVGTSPGAMMFCFADVFHYYHQMKSLTERNVFEEDIIASKEWCLNYEPVVIQGQMMYYNPTHIFFPNYVRKEYRDAFSSHGFEDVKYFMLDYLPDNAEIMEKVLCFVPGGTSLSHRSFMEDPNFYNLGWWSIPRWMKWGVLSEYNFPFMTDQFMSECLTLSDTL